jgi:hypothetical protein
MENACGHVHIRRSAESMIEVVESSCPYCGEPVELAVDESGGRHQVYVEDCPVCCRPWQVVATRSGDGAWEVALHTADE